MNDPMPIENEKARIEFLASSMLLCSSTGNQNRINGHRKDGRERHKVIYRGQGLAMLPLVNSLRSSKAEYHLKIIDSHPRLLAETGNIPAGCSHINDRYCVHFIYSPVPAPSRTVPARTALKLISCFLCFHPFAFLCQRKKPPASYKTSGFQNIFRSPHPGGYHAESQYSFVLYGRAKGTRSSYSMLRRESS